MKCQPVDTHVTAADIKKHLKYSKLALLICTRYILLISLHLGGARLLTIYDDHFYYYDWLRLKFHYTLHTKMDAAKSLKFVAASSFSQARQVRII